MVLRFFQNEKAGLYVFLLSPKRYCPETCPSVLSKTDPIGNMPVFLSSPKKCRRPLHVLLLPPQIDKAEFYVSLSALNHPHNRDMFLCFLLKTPLHDVMSFRLLQNLPYKTNTCPPHVFSVSFQVIAMTSYVLSSARALNTTTPHVSKLAMNNGQLWLFLSSKELSRQINGSAFKHHRDKSDVLPFLSRNVIQE
jgi:hypothetical protein